MAHRKWRGDKGKGQHRADRPTNTKACPECKGTGTVTYRDLEGVKQSEQCDVCGGKGHVKR